MAPTKNIHKNKRRQQDGWTFSHPFNPRSKYTYKLCFWHRHAVIQSDIDAE
jgi:hypothetical protein